ncbi:hypothetical protein Pint_01020 [Pistacia integerrima]|uniref:Uncharacterized protein n=1 Tax=Pistacia integerrima TaxID=434235 RepID=A0ACC0ZRE5_9ROSI|nr:hypothetical protein Pint_01020 [Pistacia integerrima]
MMEEKGQLFLIQEFAVMLTSKLGSQFGFTPRGKRFRSRKMDSVIRLDSSRVVQLSVH